MLGRVSSTLMQLSNYDLTNALRSLLAGDDEPG